MIDWWLFFASNILVVTMAFHTYLAFLCEMAKSKMKDSPLKERAFWIPKLNLTMKRSERPSKDKLVECCEDKNGVNGDESSALNNEDADQVKIKDNSDDDQNHAIRQARRFNDFAKVIYLAIVVTFNIVFWIMAVTEYSRPAEYYLGDYGSKNKTLADGEEGENLPENNSTEV